MGVAKRKFPRGYKALLHFDYPYFAEPGDGLRDEIGVLEWSLSTNNFQDVKFVGTEIPIAENVAGTPKFGYRCMQCATVDDNIFASKAGYFDMDSTKTYEIEFFVRKTSETSGGPIVCIWNENNNMLARIGLENDGKIHVQHISMNIYAVSSAGVTLNTWAHVRVRFDKGTLIIMLDGVVVYNEACSWSLTDTYTIRLGGFTGQLDEFLFRQVFGGKVYNSVPEVPYKGYIDTYGIGGTGKQGALNLTSGSSRINTVQEVTFQDSSTVKMDTLPTGEFLGIHGTYQAGDEVLIIKNQTSDTKPDTIESGLYCLRRIKDISGTTITLDSPVTEFTFDKTVGTTKYTIKMHLVPNYSSVTIGSSATVTCRNTDDGSGGLVIFRCQGNVNIQGKILTSGTGSARYDYFQMTHNHLPERFIYNAGGGVIILSEGTVTAGDNARIGASWSGAGKAGAGVSSGHTNGNNGGSGYGGSGGTKDGYTQAGGVGGGSGGSHYGGRNGMSPGYDSNRTGGTLSDMRGGGGTQGVKHPEVGCLAGGGALQNYAAQSGYLRSGYAGSCVLIICKKLQVSLNAISTGGGGGLGDTGSGCAGGGGGTGMCYLAYEEAI